MPAIPSWDPDLSVGNPELDRHHQKLFELARHAVALLERESSFPEEFHRVLNDITDLAFRHFAAEEELLARNGCPSLAAHKAEHDTYLEQLTRVLYQGAAGVQDKAALVVVMETLVGHHLHETDLPNKGYMRARH